MLSASRIKNTSWDKWLFLAIVILSGIGLLAVYESSASLALKDFSNQYYYVVEQSKWCFLGIILMLVLSRINYQQFYKLALPIFCFSIIFLIAVFLPFVGVKTYGAYRWLDFGFINFQPAELAKLSIIIYLSAWFSYPEKRRLGAFLLLTGLVVGLIILEPDLSTAIIVLIIAFTLYFFSGTKLSEFVFIIPIVVIVMTVIAMLAPYRIQRFMTFLNPQSDPLGTSYQIRQILLSLGSGGWSGVGIGKSRQKYAYLPEANTDSIFAIIGEEVGFIGSLFVILLYLFILWRGFKIAKLSKDLFAKYCALGITSWIGIQTTMNLASIVALIPLTGIPLPFISYGGSSMILLLCASGILLSISRHS